MDNQNNYKVIITKSGEATDDVASKIASLFKISVEKANNILLQDEFVVKKQTNKETAEKFYNAITAAGANCHIEEILSEEEMDLPTIEDIATPADIKPLGDPTRSDITPLNTKPLNFSLEDRVTRKANPSNPDNPDEAQLESIDPANFCPECGTIRASANSKCVHCGYDPADIRRKYIKALAIKIAASVIVVIAVIFLALPFYQQYAKRVKIQEDLTLAFDTRNQVTEFIKKTNFWPNQNIDAELPKLISNQSIESIVVGNRAVITITLKKQVLEELDLNSNNRTLIFTPNTLKGRIVWNCLKGTLAEAVRPEICRKQER